jgi:hypothetical protein
MNAVVYRRPHLARRRGFLRRRALGRPSLGAFLEALGNRHHLGFSQPHFPNAGRNIEARTAFDAHGLQGDRLVEAAEQHMCANARTNRRAGCGAGIVALEGARPDVRRRRHNVPDDHGAVGVTDIDTELRNAAGVAVPIAAIGFKLASHVLGRSDDIPPAAFHVTGEHTHLDASRRSVGLRRKRKHADRRGRGHRTKNVSHKSLHCWSCRGHCLTSFCAMHRGSHVFHPARERAPSPFSPPRQQKFTRNLATFAPSLCISCTDYPLVSWERAHGLLAAAQTEMLRSISLFTRSPDVPTVLSWPAQFTSSATREPASQRAMERFRQSARFQSRRAG